MPVPPRNPSSRRPLTEDEILAAALALLDAGGPDAVTVRRIAIALDAGPGAVYRYFPDRAAVQHALVDRLLGEAGRSAVAGAAVAGGAAAGGAAAGGAAAGGVAGGGAWQGDVEALALALRQRLRAHPGAVPLILSAPLTGPHARALGGRLRALLAGGGLTGAEVDSGVHLVKAYVLGAIALDTGGRQFRWGLRRVLGGLSGPA